MTQRNKWEEQITEILAEKMDVDFSDASGIVEAQPFIMAQSWTLGLSAADTAEKIMNA